MQEKILKDMSGEALTRALEENAYSVENTIVERQLSKEQREEMAKRQSDLAERKTEIEDNIREYLTPLKEELKDIDEERKLVARTTKKGFTESKETIYWMQDFEAKQMVAYDGAGDLVKSRRMQASERQSTILQINKAV